MENNVSKDEKKVLAAHKRAIDNATAILAGKPFAPVSKIKGEDVPSIMKEFFEEEAKARKDEFKVKFKEILIAKVETDRFLAQKKAEFRKIELEKMKEFTKKVNDCINIITGIDQLEKDWTATLTGEAVAKEIEDQQENVENNDNQNND